LLLVLDRKNLEIKPTTEIVKERCYFDYKRIDKIFFVNRLLNPSLPFNLKSQKEGIGYKNNKQTY